MLFFWIFSQLLGLLGAYHWDGNTMYDLELQGSSFVAETAAWYQSAYWNSGSAKTTSCDGNTIMGGWKIMGGTGGYWERTYSSLPIHNVIYLSIRIYPIDSWDYQDNDHFELFFDGVTIVAWTFQGNGALTPTNICGNYDFKDLPALSMYATVPHTAGSLVFRVISGLSDISFDESLGFRDIKMEFKQISNPPSSFSFCGVTQGFPLEYNACPCAANQYMTPADSGNCADCDSLCLTCSGSATACQTCPLWYFLAGTTCTLSCNYPLYLQIVNGVTLCSTPCSGSIVMWDGSCNSVCSYSNSYGSYQLTPVTVNTFSQCNYPCATAQYLYWNASCISSCPSPLTNQVYKDRNFCGYSCATAQYLYWNGSCINTCPWPLSPETQNTVTAYQRKFCWYTCQPNEYLYWNGSCLSICPAPLTPEVQGTNPTRNFCWYTCGTGQYLYWNGSCIGTCPWPLSPETQGTNPTYQRKFCWYYCQPSEFMYWNGSCLSSCPAPLTPEVQGTNPTRNFCWYTCSTAQYLYWNGSCLNNCPWPLSSEVQGTNPTYQRNFCWYYCQPGEFMYWNGSCLSTCPSPLTSEVQGSNLPRQFCWYTCSTTQYLYWNGSCLSSCPAPLAIEVQGTNLPRQFCWYTCPTTQYLYWNGSCLGTCPAPLSPEIQVDRKFCWYGCQPNEYLYWNGSCQSTCDSPLDSEIQGIFESRNFCWSPCQADKYVYWNRSCLDDCVLPLTSKIDPNAKFCVNTCGDFPSNYLYSNQSCLATCPNPLSVLNNPGVQYCVNLCPAGTYLYENQTCLNNCSSPYLKRIEPVDIQYCDRPCSQPNIYWYQNASCLSECKFPYVQFNYSGIIQCLPPCKDDSEYFYDFEKKCSKRCESPYKIEFADVIKVCKVGVEITVEEVEKLQETAASIETQGKFTSGGMKAASAINSNNPASALLAGLSSMMQYIRYMKINYPPKVQMLFLVSAGSPISLSFGVKIPSFIEKHLTDEPLSEAFDKYDINSNFVSNLWDFMVSLVLIFLAILVLAILKIITFGLPKLNAVVSRALQMLKWNFPIMMICGSSGDIFFYASLQLRSSPFKSLSSTICCIVSIFMMILVVVLLGIAWKIVSVMHRRLRNPEARETSQWKGFEILYSEYEEKSFFSLAYMFLFVSRGIIFNLTLAILYEYPIVQCIIINFCNIAMICYVLYLRPLKELLALVQLWINEGLVNILSISVFILAILEPTGVHREATRVGVGDVILFVIKTFNTAGLVFMGIGMLLLILSMYRTLKTLREKNIKSPIKMVKVLIFGVPEEEKVSPAGQEEFAKKPKIVKPLRKEKMWTREENSSVIEMKEDRSLSHLFSDNSHQILPTNILQTEFQESRVQATDLDMSQSFFNPQKKISSLKRVYKVRVQGRNDILESSKEEVEKKTDEDEMKLWYSNLRKLKRRLNNNSSKKIDLTIETNHSSSL